MMMMMIMNKSVGTQVGRRRRRRTRRRAESLDYVPGYSQGEREREDQSGSTVL